MATKISALTTIAKSSVGTHHLLTAATSQNYKLLASDLFPSLTVSGTTGQELLSLANQNVFTQKKINSASNLLSIATVSNELVFTVNAANIDLSQCNNNTSLFLTTVNLASNVTGTLPATNGGTGLSSFPVKSVFISHPSTANTMQAVSLASNGQLLIGGTSGPLAATLTAGTNVTITNAANAITIAAPTPANVVVKENSTNDIVATGANVRADKNVVFENTTYGITYTTKASVTQITSLSTAVTIDATAGKIVTFPASLSTSQAEFTVNNNTVTTNSLIFLTLVSPGISTEADNANIIATVSAVANGSFKVVLSNPFGHASDAAGRTVQFLVIN
jgi:hypothetical protein